MSVEAMSPFVPLPDEKHERRVDLLGRIITVAVTMVFLAGLGLAGAFVLKGSSAQQHTDSLLTSTVCRSKFRVPIDKTDADLSRKERDLATARDTKLDLFLNGLFDSVTGKDLDPAALERTRKALDLDITRKQDDVDKAAKANDQAIAHNDILVHASPELFALLCKNPPKS